MPGIRVTAAACRRPTRTLLRARGTSPSPMIERSLLEVAITGSRPLSDSEMYTLLTAAQDNITDDELDTRSFTFGGGQNGSRLHFREDGFKSMLGYAMVSQGMTRDVGVYPAFRF